jgi:hypothetical protein
MTVLQFLSIPVQVKAQEILSSARDTRRESIKFQNIFDILMANCYLGLEDLPNLFMACDKFCLNSLKTSKVSMLSINSKFSLIGQLPTANFIRWACMYKIKFDKILYSNPVPREPDGWSAADYYGCQLVDFSVTQKYEFNPFEDLKVLSLQGCLLKGFRTEKFKKLCILLLHDTHSVKEVSVPVCLDLVDMDDEYRKLLEVRFKYQYDWIRLQDIKTLTMIHVCDRRVCSTATINFLLARGVIAKVYLDSLYGKEQRHIQLEKPTSIEGYFRDDHYRGDYETVFIAPGLVQMIPF